MPSTGDIWQVVAIDLDVDGRIDLVELPLAPRDSVPPRILHNVGGAFAPIISPDFDWPRYAGSDGVGDIDEDGDPDLLARGKTGSLLFRNLHRQIAWRSLPRIGRPLTLDVYGRANQTYVLAASLSSVALPATGIGTLRVDPTTLTVMAVGGIDPLGRAEFSAQVPNAPGLLGATVFWQALTLPPLRLGNLERTTLQAR
ncbi:MAG: VCBS repeat-containing protein [Planctomycetes bacterium]|nr:VCBS repeat-containing protein [Planctomycetota bacterium]